MTLLSWPETSLCPNPLDNADFAMGPLFSKLSTGISSDSGCGQTSPATSPVTCSQPVRSEVLVAVCVERFPFELLFQILGGGVLDEGVF